MRYQPYLQQQSRVCAVLTHPLFFVCGAPKSGTTWLQRLIDAHPHAQCGGEGHFFDRLWDGLLQSMRHYNEQQRTVAQLVYEGQPYYRGWDQPALLYTLYGLIGSVLAQRGLPPGVRIIGDKTPRYTLYLSRLWHLFPQAKVVHLIRDGRDVVVSSLYHEARSTGTPVAGRDAAALRDSVAAYARVWRENVSTARASAAERPATAGYHEVRYESLHAAPEATLTELFGFLGLEAPPAVLQRCLRAADFERLSGRPKGAADGGAFHRKGIVGDWREHFDEAAQSALLAEAGDLLAELGYL